jgi:hypothetical protein
MYKYIYIYIYIYTYIMWIYILFYIPLEISRSWFDDSRYIWALNLKLNIYRVLNKFLNKLPLMSFSLQSDASVLLFDWHLSDFWIIPCSVHFTTIILVLKVCLFLPTKVYYSIRSNPYHSSSIGITQVFSDYTSSS